jgi:hypothetical protein
MADTDPNTDTSRDENTGTDTGAYIPLTVFLSSPYCRWGAVVAHGISVGPHRHQRVQRRRGPRGPGASAVGQTQTRVCEHKEEREKHRNERDDAYTRRNGGSRAYIGGRCRDMARVVAAPFLPEDEEDDDDDDLLRFAPLPWKFTLRFFLRLRFSRPLPPVTVAEAEAVPSIDGPRSTSPDASVLPLPSRALPVELSANVVTV